MYIKNELLPLPHLTKFWNFLARKKNNKKHCKKHTKTFYCFYLAMVSPDGDRGFAGGMNFFEPSPIKEVDPVVQPTS